MQFHQRVEWHSDQQFMVTVALEVGGRIPVEQSLDGMTRLLVETLELGLLYVCGDIDLDIAVSISSRSRTEGIRVPGE